MVTSLTIESVDSNGDNAIGAGDTVTVVLTANEAILLPPIRLIGQENPPDSISGGGTTWTYTYRIKENFGLDAPGTLQLQASPFRIRDIAGNLSEDLAPDATTRAFDQGAVTFTPDFTRPSLTGSSAMVSQETETTFAISFTTDEPVRDPVARYSGASFELTKGTSGDLNSDEATWSGMVEFAAERVPNPAVATLEITIEDLVGNGRAYSATPGSLSATPTAVMLSAGIPPFVVFDADGFNGRNVPIVVTAPGGNYGLSTELSIEGDADGASDKMRWEVDSGVLTIRVLGDDQEGIEGHALFTTFFSGDEDETLGTLTEDLSSYAGGDVVFDLRFPDGRGMYDTFSMKIDHIKSQNFCNCGVAIDISEMPDNEWVTVRRSINDFTTHATENLDLTKVKTGIVLNPDNPTQDGGASIMYQMRNIRWEGLAEASTPPVLGNAPAQVLSVSQALAEPIVFPNTGGAPEGGGCAEDSAKPLPAGLSLVLGGTPASCAITGTPTAVTAKDTYTITATNASGMSTATVEITVGAAIRSDVEPHASITIMAATDQPPPNTGTGVVVFDDTYLGGFDAPFVYEQGSQTTDPATGLVTGQLVTDADRGMVVQLSTSTETMAVLGITVSGDATMVADLSAAAGGILQLDVRVIDEPDDVTATYRFKLNEPAGGEVASGGLTQIGLNTWRTLRVDLSQEPWTDIDLSQTKIVQFFPSWEKADGTVLQMDRVIFYPPSQ